MRRARERSERALSGVPSANGREMEKIADAHGHVYTRPVPGLPVEGVRVRIGDVETLLVHVLRRFHYEVEELRPDDVTGWHNPSRLRKGLPESNLVSGTAVRIRPGAYPAGVRGGFWPRQLAAIRSILDECDGVVRWGGDDKRPDEALFYVAVAPGDARLPQLAERIVRWNWTPGRGAGSGAI
ncbi:hypothetical protein [Streptomyces sp. WMMC905]|uniref:hypothetical protein n=1 Tax=Streptomyces sp. WMMC905 TaxID=3404123 RepID=UPI003B937A8E